MSDAAGADQAGHKRRKLRTDTSVPDVPDDWALLLGLLSAPMHFPAPAAPAATNDDDDVMDLDDCTMQLAAAPAQATADSLMDLGDVSQDLIKAKADADAAAAAQAALPAVQAAPPQPTSPRHNFDTFCMIFNILQPDVHTPEEILCLFAPTKHGRCMYQKDPNQAAVCGAKVGNTTCDLDEPFRANLCTTCRKKSNGQPRYSPTEGSTVTFLEHNPATLERVLVCTGRDQLNANLAALGGGFGIVKDRISCSNSRVHLAADEASHDTHLFGLVGKIATRRLVRVFESAVQIVTIVSPVTSKVQHYEIRRVHEFIDGPDFYGIPIAMRIA